jgi:hypothetical protein
MSWLLFLSRLSFICGFFLLLSISLRITDWVQEDSLASTIIIIGYFMGLVVIPVTSLCYLMMAFSKKMRNKLPSGWLVISNIIFLGVLIYYIIYLNEQ